MLFIARLLPSLQWPPFCRSASEILSLFVFVAMMWPIRSALRSGCAESGERAAANVARGDDLAVVETNMPTLYDEPCVKRYAS